MIEGNKKKKKEREIKIVNKNEVQELIFQMSKFKFKKDLFYFEQRDWLRKCCKLHYHLRKQKSNVKSYKENQPIPLENVDIPESIGNLEEIWFF